jgi:hypothetical protein
MLDRRRLGGIIHLVHREDRALLGSTPSARCDARRWTGALVFMPRLLSCSASATPIHLWAPTAINPPRNHQPIFTPQWIVRGRTYVRIYGTDVSFRPRTPSDESLGYFQLPLRG